MHGDSCAAREHSPACAKTCIYSCFLNRFVQLSSPCESPSDFPLYQCMNVKGLPEAPMAAPALWSKTSKSVALGVPALALTAVSWVFTLLSKLVIHISVLSAVWEESQRSNMKMIFSFFFPKNLLQGSTLISFEIFDFLLQITNTKPDGFIFIYLGVFPAKTYSFMCNFR